MAEKKLSTRITLRNDSRANWESSEKTLRKGEVALAKTDNGTYELRVGQENQKWTQALPLEISAANVVGLDEKLGELASPTKHYEAESLEELNELTGLNNGDTAVVITPITEGKNSYTAYVYDATLTGEADAQAPVGWTAMDGNYDATNVYFGSDISSVTEAFGKYGAKAEDKDSNGYYTLSCEGKSLFEFLKDALTETKQPTITQPSCSFNISTSSLTGEYGSDYSKSITATFTVDRIGEYQYGPATGVTYDASISANTAANLISADATGMVKGNTLTAVGTVSGTFGEVDTINYYATYSRTAGAQPLTNAGTAADNKHPAISAENDTQIPKTLTITGYYPAFYVFTSELTTPPTAITASSSKDENDIVYSKIFNSYDRNSFTSSANWYQLFYVVPKDKNTNTSWSGKNTSTGLPVNPEACTDCTVTLQDNTLVNYKVFIVQNSKAAAPATIQMTYSKQNS